MKRTLVERLTARFLQTPGTAMRIWSLHKLRRRWPLSWSDGVHSSLPIDIVIPVSSKDAHLLRLVIIAAKQFIKHPVKTIYVVHTLNSDLRDLTHGLGVVLVPETDVLSPAAQGFEYRTCGKDRAGWIKQQLIKLSGDRLSSSEQYLVLDADTVFVRDTVFEAAGREIMYCSDEYYHPYWITHRKLLGSCRRYPMSFVAHHMLFSAERVAELRRTIERHSGQVWDQAIMNALDPDEISSFSEYETYGNFVWRTAPGSIETRYWFNRSKKITSDQSPELRALVEEFGKSARAVSAHAHLL